MLDEDEFLSPHGLRSLSRLHRDAAVRARRSTGDVHRRSTTSRPSRAPALFGGNSNWRGPVWFPVNYLLDRGARAGSPRSSATTTASSTRPVRPVRLTLDEVADDLTRRLVGAVPRRRRRAVGRCFGDRGAVPGRPGLARPAPVPRVLPRRHRRRPRRLAPDRLDRAGRQPHPRLPRLISPFATSRCDTPGESHHKVANQGRGTRAATPRRGAAGDRRFPCVRPRALSPVQRAHSPRRSLRRIPRLRCADRDRCPDCRQSAPMTTSGCRRRSG